MPLVSVIMNCFNSAKYLQEALDSVYQQTFKDYDIIFYDNQSTDGSDKIARGYGKPLQYFRAPGFLPLGAARNAAINKASGKYIAFLDCDDIWLPDKLEKQVALFESRQELGLVYSDCYFINSSGKMSDRTYFSRVKPFRDTAFNKLFQYNPIPLLTAVIQKDTIIKVGDFNPRFEIAEEYDLWLRIADNYAIDFIDEPLGKYRMHNQSATSKNHILGYREGMLIRNSWLKKYPALKKESGGRAKALKMWPAFLGAIGNIIRNKNIKSVRESFGLMWFMCLLYCNRIKA
jgi:glycosyltransferase involved in cell wall biosynthesis